VVTKAPTTLQMYHYTRDGTGRDFCDLIRPVTLLLNRPVNRRKLSAVDRPVDWQKLQHLGTD